ncbi:MAG TPA: Mur ligase family protein [Thermoanaerobaculia bacterium]|jgi:dihydrofolate synthase/folylpolyglutamate synthase|nr:Mur ligase family protein [Thermoanaerobaculia bacterium]
MPGLPSLARLEALGQRGMKLGLAAIDEVCERLGRPERRVPAVLVAGTNGKGSTAATLAAIAGEAGLRAGLYTSPHLGDVTERIRLGPNDIASEALDAQLAAVFAAADRAPAVPLTYFEAMTAAAFMAFARAGLDLAVLEVGLGGRFDATNVAPAILSVVTSISIDHVEDLGPTIAAIAFEKSGVFREGRPALVASRLPEALAVFEDAAARTGAELHRLSEETAISGLRATAPGTRFDLATPAGRYALVTPLSGAHQAENTAAAVRAAELLAPDFRIDARAIERGVASVRWPGRLERFEVGGKTVLLDGCHNAGGAAALARFIAEVGLRPDLVFGAMADKDLESMGAALRPVVGRIRLVLTASARAASPEELRRRFADGTPAARTAPGLVAALEELLADPASETIIVAGSLYLVGEARALLLSGPFAQRP